MYLSQKTLSVLLSLTFLILFNTPHIYAQQGTYTEDQCVGGVSSASSCLGGCTSGHSHTEAFDDIFDAWDGWVSDNTQDGWLAYEFTSPKKISKYVIHPRGHEYPGDGGNPRSWTFEGYNGATWEVLDSRSGINWSPMPSPQEQMFTFSNDTTFNKYRLNISENGDHPEVGLTEMEMMEIETPGTPWPITDLQAGHGDELVTLTWSAPPDGGVPITSYQVEYGTVSSGSFDSTYYDDDVPGATITGLTNGIAYQFRVIATNTHGDSDPSNVVAIIPGEYTPVSGGISTNTTWDISGSPYLVTGNITIGTPVTLTIDPGVEVMFSGYYWIRGRIDAQGTADNMIVFTSSQPSPAPGDWHEIVLNNGTSIVKHAIFEYADRAVHGGSPNIENSIFRYNNTGLYFRYNCAPAITYNTIINNDHGISHYGSYYSYPLGTYNYNSIYDNNLYNFYFEQIGGAHTVNAEYNWWGTTDPYEIMDSIHPYSTSALDFTPFLDGPNGDPTGGGYLYGGTLTDATWTLDQSPYIVLSDFIINEAATVTIEPGVEVKFDGYHSMRGRIDAQGTSEDMIVFTSNKPSPVPGDWFEFVATSSIIKYAIFEYADRAIHGGSPVIENSIFRYNNTALYFRYQCEPMVMHSTITQNDYGFWFTGDWGHFPYGKYYFNSIVDNNLFNVYLEP
ncbi:fibronectin type III domain-containing protein, partial [Candidatus Omnitrophota bacterium]